MVQVPENGPHQYMLTTKKNDDTYSSVEQVWVACHFAQHVHEPRLAFFFPG